MQTLTEKDHKARIDMVIDFILKNLNEAVSLETLADVANYSPFHLQKVFKKTMGESPKQYILKLRLENALHLMIIHEDKSIQEIAMDCGFSSPSVFSRSVKNLYGLSPEKFKTLSMQNRAQFFKASSPKPVSKLNPGNRSETNPSEELILQEEYIEIQIKKIETIKGIYLIAPFDNTEKIKESFSELIKLATSNDYPHVLSNIYGIVTPHQGNIYKTFIAIDKEYKVSKKFQLTEIKGGKYAVFKIKGKRERTLKAAHYFFQQWLPESGYKIADIVGFETFAENPGLIDYEEIERTVHVRIEAV